MKVLLLAGGLFLAVWAVHVLLWRFWVPTAARRFLALVFLGLLPVSLLLLRALGPSSPLAVRLAPAGLSETLLFAACYLGYCLGYLSFYISLEGDSPSLSMMRALAAAGPRGLGPDQLRGALRLERHVNSRIDALAVDGMAELRDGRYRILPKGRRLLSYYRFYDRLAGVRDLTG